MAGNESNPRTVKITGRNDSAESRAEIMRRLNDTAHVLLRMTSVWESELGMTSDAEASSSAPYWRINGKDSKAIAGWVRSIMELRSSLEHTEFVPGLLCRPVQEPAHTAGGDPKFQRFLQQAVHPMGDHHG